VNGTPQLYTIFIASGGFGWKKVGRMKGREKEQRRRGEKEIVRWGVLPFSPFPLFPFS
jgi:hypothetical protein